VEAGQGGVIRHLTRLSHLSKPDGAAILAEAHRRKAARPAGGKGLPDADAPLTGAVLAMLFQKPSTRTRVSFELAMRQLGGSAIILSSTELQLGRGETIADTARILSRFADIAMVRANTHADLESFVTAATIPVINGLTEAAHPAQALADVMTVEDRLNRPVAGTRWAWLGDGNNMAESLIAAARLFDFELILACPPGYRPTSTLRSEALGYRIMMVDKPEDAVDGADVVATDTWISMGQEHDARKLRAMRPYQVTPALMARAAPHAQFLHCLPAPRGEEVLDAVIDGPMSAVWDEAENRLHVQKAILLWAMNLIG
jgi:ornithine carbamoyltransferase